MRTHPPLPRRELPRPLCLTCTAKVRPEQTCSRCRRRRRVFYRSPTGAALCRSCGEPRPACHLCNRPRRRYGRTPDGEPLCETCWKHHPTARRPCRDCHGIDRLRDFGRCAACAARHQLDQVLGGPDATVPAVLQPVRDALLRTTPEALLKKLAPASGCRPILDQLVATGRPVTHETLDACRPAKSVDHLRAALVAGGALPARDEHLAHLERWLTAAYARIPAGDDRRALRSYTTWHHLRRLRRPRKTPTTRAPTTRTLTSTTRGQADGVRGEIGVAIRFLAHLHGQGLTLRTCRQEHLDAWLAQGAPARARVGLFLQWTARHGYPPLHASARLHQSGTEKILHDRRWALVRRLAHAPDSGLDATIRAAGLLVLLFAQPPSRIILLTTHHLTEHDDGTLQVRLGSHPTPMPAPLDDLLRHLADHPRGRSATEPLASAGWLFPGGQAAHPMSASHLAHRLKAIGLRPRAARHTALMDLAGQLPAVVVSRLLGFHQNTADRWRDDAQGLSPDYAADLTRR